VSNFMNKMVKIYNIYGAKRPIVITEFAVADWDSKLAGSSRYSEQEVLTFMQAVLPWLEEQDFIAGYAWFSFDSNSPVGATSSLFDDNGQLNSLGRYYASVTTENRTGDLSISASLQLNGTSGTEGGRINIWSGGN
jgi:Glycosyl hydrolase catalytic core